MSEIEKMYENAGIKKLLYCGICRAQEHALGLCAETKCEPFYPPFTAEKQLELIKWLLYNPKVDYLNMFYKNEEDYLDISIDCNNGYSYENSFDDNFEIAIASAFNTFWQSLTPEEKQQVKGILE